MSPDHAAPARPRPDLPRDLVLSGEIHYFRIPREGWERRLRLLADSGADTVATYVPWVVHERGGGSIDLTGHTDPALDLGAFIDLAGALGLDVLVRPGPFVMAEMTGEGVPTRLRGDHPEIVPTGWEGRACPTGDIDYLAPAFLVEVRHWYQAVGAVVGPRMAPRGGNVVAVQLDNEVGMLAWVANTPQLTDAALRDLRTWLDARHGTDLASRYPGMADALDGGASFADLVRSPRPEWARALRLDLGRFSRVRFARYLTLLSEMADDAGMGGVPLLVNVHGTHAGSGASFPIGISQLAASYADRPGWIAGTDHYLGDLTLRTAADFHLMNAYLAASAGPGRPTSSLEFEAGTGDYGDDLGNDVDPSAVVLKTHLALAQGQRLLNYYLFAGGYNGVADPPETRGTTRFAITGERHGFAAPIDPEGRPGRPFASTHRALALSRALEPWLAGAVEEHDDVALGMVLDDYLTEYRAPNDPAADAVGDLEYARGNGPRGVLGRMLLTLGYRYGALDLQRPASDGDPRVIVLGSPGSADRAVQERLAQHVLGGGGLLVLGEVPTEELDGTPCTVLADALGIRVTGELRDSQHWFTSVCPVWGRGTERRVGRLQLLEAPGADVIAREAMSGTACGVVCRAGTGTAVVLACDIGGDLDFWRTALETLGVRPGLEIDPASGLFGTTTRRADGTRVVHLINVSGYEVSTRVVLDGVPACGGEAVTLPPRTSAAWVGAQRIWPA